MKVKTLTTALAAVLMTTGCADRMKNPRAESTAALIQRRAYLLEREKSDDYGIFYGPTRWISHAVDEKKSREELQAVNAELAVRR